MISIRDLFDMLWNSESIKPKSPWIVSKKLLQAYSSMVEQTPDTGQTMDQYHPYLPDDCQTPETCGVCHICQRQQPCPLHTIFQHNAGVGETADPAVSNTAVHMDMRVQLSPPAPFDAN